MLRRLLSLAALALLGAGCTRTVYVQVPAPPAPRQQVKADPDADRKRNEAVLRNLQIALEQQQWAMSHAAKQARTAGDGAAKQAWRERWKAQWRREHAQQDRPTVLTPAPESYASTYTPPAPAPTPYYQQPAPAAYQYAEAPPVENYSYQQPGLLPPAYRSARLVPRERETRVPGPARLSPERSLRNKLANGTAGYGGGYSGGYGGYSGLADGYYRNGTYVQGYSRSYGGGRSSSYDGRAKTVHVDSYFRKDGTFVNSHMRRRPRR